MDILDYSEQLFLFVDHNLLAYCKRKWIYKNSTLVIDFKYENLNFAYDIYSQGDNFSLDIINRDWNNDKKYFPLVNKKTHLLTTKEFSQILYTLNENCKDIIAKFKAQFQYKITVIVPVYNRAELVKKCIETLNEQTLSFDDFEVIFVDDFSSDSSIESIKSHVDKRLNYRILARPINSGSASAPRNDGLMAAKGQYIYFIDSDDYIYSYTLAEMLNSAEENNSDVVYVKYDGDPGRPWGRRPFAKGNVANAKVAENHLVRSLMSSKLIRFSIIKDNKLFYPLDIKVGEDRLFMMQVLSCAKRYSILGEKPYYYITNHDQGRITHSGSDLVADYKIVSRVFSSIYIADMSHVDKVAMLSAWMNVVVESYILLRLASKKIKLKDKKQYYDRLYRDYENHKEFVALKYVYKEFRDLAQSFFDNDFEASMEISNK